jgi:GNAT superfamily N-acetyltransferase
MKRTRLKTVRVPAYGVKITKALRGKVVGRAYLYVMTNDLHERPFGLMEDVFVDPDHRGSEIGTTLVKRVVAEAKRHRCYKLIATSRHARSRVHALYDRLGFKDHGREFRIDFS